MISLVRPFLDAILPRLALGPVGVLLRPLFEKLILKLVAEIILKLTLEKQLKALEASLDDPEKLKEAARNIIRRTRTD